MLPPKTDNSILLVDKPGGVTSHDVVDFVRKKFSIKKAGHAGTLDPMATGLLVLLLGGATKLSGRFLSDDKEYVAEIKLGTRTDTADAMGAVISESPVTAGPDEVRGAVLKFCGEIEQMPPMFSAKKHKGKKLYEYARKGIEIERQPRKVNIMGLDITSMDLPVVGIKVKCSKGTYIRQLASDIGDALGCGGHLISLRRTGSGGFSVDKAVTMERLSQMTVKELDDIVIAV